MNPDHGIPDFLWACATASYQVEGAAAIIADEGQPHGYREVIRAGRVL